MNKDFSSKILNKIVLVGIILTLLALLSMPIILTAIFKSNFSIVGSSIPTKISIGIYICAIPYVIALFLLRKLCKMIAINKPFSEKIPRYLKQISICAFSEILIYNAIQLVLYYVFNIYLYGLTIVLAIIVSFVSLAIGFLSLVMSKLFEMAIEIKDENDKTI